MYINWTSDRVESDNLRVTLADVIDQFHTRHSNTFLYFRLAHKDEVSDDPFHEYPLYMWISPVEASWKWGSGTYNTIIDGPSRFAITLEKTVLTRLPAPFSEPSCIQQGGNSVDSYQILKIPKINVFWGLFLRCLMMFSLS